MCDRGSLSATVASAALAAFTACGGSASADDAADPEPVPASGQEAPNVLTEEERALGFELLFDGESLERWRGFKREDPPAGWKVEDGVVHFTPGVEGGDIITREQFDDFDLRLEWKISEGGNSGIFFRVTEEAERTYHTGPEMQVLDDARHVDGGNAKTSTGANYALHAPSESAVRPVGEWNEARIVADGNHVEHWLNGVKIVEYELGSEEWEALVAGSKFIEWPLYGRQPSGHIGLQDHGDHVWYRSIRIRRLGG